jgi:hypothetical protein
MLETNYTLNLGQLFQIALELKIYLWQKLKLDINKQLGSSIPKVGTIVVAINNHMVVIQE